MLNFGGHVLNEYPKVVTQGQQQDEKDNGDGWNTAHRCVRD